MLMHELPVILINREIIPFDINREIIPFGIVLVRALDYIVIAGAGY